MATPRSSAAPTSRAHPLAVVLEVGLRALREREVLVALGLAVASELVEILLDGLLHRGLGLHGSLLRLGGLMSPAPRARASRLALVHHLGVDDVLLVGGTGAVAGGAVAGGGGLLGLGLLLGALVHGLGDLVERGLQGLGLAA